MQTHEIHAPHSLHDQVHARITSDLAIYGRNVSFELQNAEVVLHGVVHSYYQKQLVQESLRNIDGLNRIDNQLQVVVR